MQVEPATAAVDIVDKMLLHHAANERKNLGCSVESVEYLFVAQYDSTFNAFHNTKQSETFSRIP